jgi:hypothetical protein
MKRLGFRERETLHYRLHSENFEAGAKVFSRGVECSQILLIVAG